MSILGNAIETLSHLGAIVEVIIAALAVTVAMGVSLALAVKVRVYCPRMVVGPGREVSILQVLGMVIALVAGFLSMALITTKYYQSRGLTPGTAPGAADSAFLATVPALVLFVVMGLVDFATGGVAAMAIANRTYATAVGIADFVRGGFGLLATLGLGFRRFPIGVAKGLLAAVVILPPTYFLTYVADWFYRKLQIPHPQEHELLKTMREPQDPRIQWTLIIAAAFVAPLCEEFLFRGHLQTLIRRAIVAVTAPPRGNRFAAGFPVGGFPVFPPDGLPAMPALPGPPPVWQTWVAIVLTSALFALVHPLWMAPPIFFLALGLGYCYERTGNLWTSITVHCAFNSLSTFLYLNLQ